MKKEELKYAIDRIKLDKDRYDNIYNTLLDKKISASNKDKTNIIKPLKYAVATVVMIVAGVIISLPVRAVINSLLKERLESLSDDYIAEEIEKLDTAENEGYSYSRDFSEEENKRMRDLYLLYKDSGLFPEKELSRIISENDGIEDEFYYIYEDNYFHLPDRELTDEELLQYIDFITVEEYVIVKNYEEMYKEEIEQENQIYQEEQENVSENGGITEDQAIEIVRDKLIEVFGTTLSDFDRHSYLALAEKDPFSRDTYCVNWGNIIAHQYYYFFVDAYTGEIYEIIYSNGDMYDLSDFTEESFKRLYDNMVNDSLVFLKEKMGIEGNYDIRAYYFTNGYSHTSNYAIVELIDNNEAYIFRYTSEGEFCEYSHKNVEEYQEYIMDFTEYGTSDIYIVE